MINDVVGRHANRPNSILLLTYFSAVIGGKFGLGGLAILRRLGGLWLVVVWLHRGKENDFLDIVGIGEEHT